MHSHRPDLADFLKMDCCSAWAVHTYNFSCNFAPPQKKKISTLGVHPLTTPMPPEMRLFITPPRRTHADARLIW